MFIINGTVKYYVVYITYEETRAISNGGTRVCYNRTRGQHDTGASVRTLYTSRVVVVFTRKMALSKKTAKKVLGTANGRDFRGARRAFQNGHPDGRAVDGGRNKDARVCARRTQHRGARRQYFRRTTTTDGISRTTGRAYAVHDHNERVSRPHTGRRRLSFDSAPRVNDGRWWGPCGRREE